MKKLNLFTLVSIMAFSYSLKAMETHYGTHLHMGPSEIGKGIVAYLRECEKNMTPEEIDSETHIIQKDLEKKFDQFQIALVRESILKQQILG